MIFAQFYQKSATGPELVEACGDRSVIILDGREHLQTIIEFSRVECARRGFVAFALFRGDTFSRSRRFTSIETI